MSFLRRTAGVLVLAASAITALSFNACEKSSGGQHANCDACNNLSNASSATCTKEPTCTNAACATCSGFTCTFPFADCNGNGLDGCEANLSNDAVNCGICGNGCSTGACVAGSCRAVTTIASKLNGPTGIALSADEVWWSAVGFVGEPGSIQHVSKGGGAVVTIASDNLTGGIATSSDRVLWSNASTATDGGANGALFVAPLDGGAPTMFAASQRPQGGIAVNDTDAYWLSASDTAGGLMEWSAADGGVSQIAPSFGLGLAASSHPQTIALAAGALLWINGDVQSSSVASRIDLTTHTVTENVSASPRALATDGIDFFAVDDTGSVVHLGADGTKIASWSLSDAGTSGPTRGAAADADAVYFTRANEVWQVARASGIHTLVAGAQLEATGIAVDADSIYWTTFGDASKGGGSVMRVSKR